MIDCDRCGHRAVLHGRANPPCDVSGCSCPGYLLAPASDFGVDWTRLREIRDERLARERGAK